MLADEINRAPAKVQSALLEAMQERQVTLAGETRALPRPFLVLATQNPVEHEGTYPLPEAQIDRFMLKVVVDYPTQEEEPRDHPADGDAPGATDRRGRSPRRSRCSPPGALLDEVYVDEKLLRYVVDLVFATRRPRMRPASPSLAAADPLRRLAARVDRAGAGRRRARAFLEGRGFVTPHDVKAVGHGRAAPPRDHHVRGGGRGDRPRKA